MSLNLFSNINSHIRNSGVSVITGKQYIYGNGSTSSYASLSNTNFNFSSSDLTVEFYYYHQTLGSTSNPIFSTFSYTNFFGSGVTGLLICISSNYVQTQACGYNGLNSATTLTNNTWYHIAVTRSGTTMKIYINGTLSSSDTQTKYGSPIGVNANGVICRDSIDTYPNQVLFNKGFLYQLRVTKSLVYTGNFTAPTTDLTDTGANCLLLMKVSNSVMVDGKTTTPNTINSHSLSFATATSAGITDVF
jgi:hypothetical protein